jgi:hypothetical protein
MAATRSKNTRGNYCLEQRATQLGASYALFETRGDVVMAGTGLLQGYTGNAVLSQNPQDIESFLRGIGANNLEQPVTSSFQAHLVTRPSWTILDERVKVVLPEPLLPPHARFHNSDPLVVRP